MRTNQQRICARPLWVVIISLLASALASLVAVTATPATADACSIAGPYAEVWPATNLRPGQELEIAGWGFSDIRWHESPAPTLPIEGDVAAPPQLCDFDVVPMPNIDIYWHGESTTWLGSVTGPDFAHSATVPHDATHGAATITVGTIKLAVSVGDIVQPPPPCPLATQPDGAVQAGCPEPWPCPLYGASGTQPAPGEDVAPGFLHPCPEPCVDYAHTIDDGSVYDYRWDCPDPCGQTQINPGAGDAAQAVWCPPPDPCPLYTATTGDAADGAQAVWCPPPDPCPLYTATTGDSAEPAQAVWCPDPCQVYPATGDSAEPAQAVWCPDPCPVYADGAAVPEALWVDCPPPCELVGGDAVLCPPPDPCPAYADGVPEAELALIGCPPPCEIVGDDAVWCPDRPPTSTTTADTAASSGSTTTADADAVPVAQVQGISLTQVELRAANAASTLLEAITLRILQSMADLRFAFFR